jgi:hypothetical protein
MKCDRRWWNDDRLEREGLLWTDWQARRPVWSFTFHEDGDITGDWSYPIADWAAQEPRQ